MKASKLGEALAAMAAARDFMWTHVPPGTAGKVAHDRELFKAMHGITAELSLLEIHVSADTQTTGSPS